MQPKRFQGIGTAAPGVRPGVGHAGQKAPRWLPADQETREPIRKVVDLTRLPPAGSMARPMFQAPPSSSNSGAVNAPATSKIVAASGGGALALFGFYVFMHTGLFGEILSVYAGFPAGFVLGMAVIVSITVIFKGGLGRFGGTPMAKPWAMLYAWMCLASIFSFYPSASISYIIPYGLRFMAFPLIFCAFARTPLDVRKIISWAAIGLVPVLVLCVLRGTMIEGYRFGIEGTSMENPNDLAFHLLWGSMLLLTFFLRPGKIGKILSVLAIGGCGWFLLKTASRANFISLFVIVAVVLLMVPSSVRITILVIVPVVLAVGLAAMPQETRDRMLAIAITSEADVAAQSAGATDDKMKGALGSQAARMELQKLAMDATFRHPILGSGPLMFANETAAYILEKTGRKAPWQTAHDSYLKVSSENGIPALLFYVWAILTGLYSCYKTYRRTEGKKGLEVANRNSMCLLLALVTYAFGTFFCDIVYYSYLPITIGMVAANYLAAEDAIRDHQAQLAEAVPA